MVVFKLHEMTLPQLFEKQAHINPNSIAVVFEDKKLTYEELNRKANKIARFLIAKGIGPDQLVALAMPRSLNMVVSLLVALKAGAGYLPLDPVTQQTVFHLCYTMRNHHVF